MAGTRRENVTGLARRPMYPFVYGGLAILARPLTPAIRRSAGCSRSVFPRWRRDKPPDFRRRKTPDREAMPAYDEAAVPSVHCLRPRTEPKPDRGDVSQAGTLLRAAAREDGRKFYEGSE